MRGEEESKEMEKGEERERKGRGKGGEWEGKGRGKGVMGRVSQGIENFKEEREDYSWRWS